MVRGSGTTGPTWQTAGGRGKRQLQPDRQACPWPLPGPGAAGHLRTMVLRLPHLLVVAFGLIWLPVAAVAQSDRSSRLGSWPASHMHTILERTVFQVDVMALDVCLDSATAASIRRFARGDRSRARDDSVVQAVLGARDAFARIRFVRGVGFGQFLGGIAEAQAKAVEAGLLADSTHRRIRAALPVWFSFLENRDILENDVIAYHFRTDTVRTAYLDAGGNVLMDRTDVGSERRRSVLATYFAPGSGFRDGLLDSLRPEPAETAVRACSLPPQLMEFPHAVLIHRDAASDRRAGFGAARARPGPTERMDHR